MAKFQTNCFVSLERKKAPATAFCLQAASRFQPRHNLQKCLQYHSRFNILEKGRYPGPISRIEMADIWYMIILQGFHCNIDWSWFKQSHNYSVFGAIDHLYKPNDRRMESHLLTISSPTHTKKNMTARAIVAAGLNFLCILQENTEPHFSGLAGKCLLKNTPSLEMRKQRWRVLRRYL